MAKRELGNPGPEGVGADLDFCLAAYRGEEVDLEARPKAAIALPVGLTPGQSGNFGVVRATSDRLLARRKLTRPGDEGLAERWLTEFYDRQGPLGRLGHWGFELQSWAYSRAHILLALLNARWLPAVRESLVREAALLWSMWDPILGVAVTPGCRCGKREPIIPRQERDLWLERALGDLLPPIKRGTRETQRRRKLLTQAFGDLARPLGLDEPNLRRALADVRSAPGPLVIRRHEGGHAAWFATGPRCYDAPAAAAVCAHGKPATYAVRAGKGWGGTTTVLDGSGLVVTWRKGGEEEVQVLDLAGLGELVEEIRAPEPAPAA